MRKSEKQLRMLLEHWQQLADDARENAKEFSHLGVIMSHSYGVHDGLEIAVADLQRLMDELKDRPQKTSQKTDKNGDTSTKCCIR